MQTPTDFTAPLGRFEDWNITRPAAIYIMREFARGHLQDEGERFGGFVAASAGLDIAVIADEGRSPIDTIAGILQKVGQLAAYLQTTAPTEE
ncbi:hypothetical protein EAH79_08965 [Sphingomonas koreensis]|nr:hypothetical protein EAH79_08965 [Sphingomonas koreensis]